MVLDEIQAEIENVQAGWNWALEQGQVEAIERAVDSLYQFYWLRSHFQEGEDAFRRASERLQPSDLPSPAPERTPLEKVYLKVLTQQGVFCTALGRWDLAGDLLQSSLGLARRWEAPAEIAFCLNFLGDVVWGQGDYLAAEQLYRESLAVAEAVGLHHRTGETLARLGWLTSAIKGDYLTAKSYYQQGLNLMRQVENQSEMAFLLEALGVNAFFGGEYNDSNEAIDKAPKA